jgi:hypothetical protein
MKPLTSMALVLMLCFTASPVFSQQNTNSKPTLFTAFPDVINCSEAELTRAFSIQENQNINLALSGSFSFAGTVKSNIVKYSNLQSMVIRSPYFSDAIFNLSKVTKTDNSIVYVGRIINLAYADMYELKQDAGGNYQLIKLETARQLPDCSMH